MTKPYCQPNLLLNLFLAAAIYLVADPLAAAGLYKWVDDEGNIRYSDRLPASQARKSHSELNAQGVVVSTRDAAKSEEQLAAEAEAKRKQEEKAAEDARLRKIQEQKDQVLLMTFSSAEEIEDARENRLEVLDSVIHLIQGNIETTQEKLLSLQEHALNTYTNKGKEIPGGLAQKIEHFERKIRTRSRQLELKTEEREKIVNKYEKDLARYRELKAASETN